MEVKHKYQVVHGAGLHVVPDICVYCAVSYQLVLLFAAPLKAYRYLGQQACKCCLEEAPESSKLRKVIDSDRDGSREYASPRTSRSKQRPQRRYAASSCTRQMRCSYAEKSSQECAQSFHEVGDFSSSTAKLPHSLQKLRASTAYCFLFID